MRRLRNDVEKLLPVEKKTVDRTRRASIHIRIKNISRNLNKELKALKNRL